MDAPAAAAEQDEEYEICNDNGFVYKRPRGLYPDAAPHNAQAAGPDLEAARRRRSKRHALLRLRDRRLRELARWEALEGKLLAQLPAPQPTPPQAPPASPSPAASTSASASVLDDLLAQAEVAEAILERVSGLCDQVRLLCRAHEADVVEAITALPVWGNPKDLLISMQSPDPGELDFRKDYQDEHNGGFQGFDSRQGRRAIEAGGYDGYQEAAGVSLAAVRRIKENDKTMKREPYRCKDASNLDMRRRTAAKLLLD